jgi:hypothetical protein
VASLALRELLRGPRRAGHVIATVRDVAYLEFPDSVPEPRVIALAPPAAPRLPNSIITPALDPHLDPASEVLAGDGRVTAPALEVKVTRWWDPSPVFGPLSRARLDHGTVALARFCQAAPAQPGLRTAAVGTLADACAAGDLATAAEAAEALTGLGTGLVPSGDGVICGVLLALRLLGGAISGGTRAVWLADWLGAAATCQAGQRTTALAAALLHCAAAGQAPAEVSAVLLGIAGQEPLEPAATRLLSDSTGADLAAGLVAGCRAALRLWRPWQPAVS